MPSLGQGCAKQHRVLVAAAVTGEEKGDSFPGRPGTRSPPPWEGGLGCSCVLPHPLSAVLGPGPGCLPPSAPSTSRIFQRRAFSAPQLGLAPGSRGQAGGWGWEALERPRGTACSGLRAGHGSFHSGEAIKAEKHLTPWTWAGPMAPARLSRAVPLPGSSLVQLL